MGSLRSSVVIVGAGALLASGLVVAGPATAVNIDKAPVAAIAGDNTLLSWPRGAERDKDGLLYMANTAGNSVTVYGKRADGDAAPLREIWGPATRLDAPHGLYVDGSGFVYVSNRGDSSITVYRPGANGNIEPLRRIAGASTGLTEPGHLAVDKDGRIYVPNETDSSIRVFGPKADGDAAPVRVIKGGQTGLNWPWGVDLGPRGTLYVANNFEAGLGSVTVYPADADGNEGALRTITGLTTGIDDPTDVAVDTGGNVYVSTDQSNAVHVFGPRADGNVEARVTLTGPTTQIAEVRGISVDADNVVSLAAYNADQALVFSPLVVVAPGKAGKLKVGGKPGSNKRKVSWRTPEATGGGKVKSYRVVVKDGKKTVLSKSVKRRSLVLKQSRLGSGKHTVTVSAKNKAGIGKPVSVSFKVSQ
jgi:hypothetical protein